MMARKEQGLGRGISALFDDANAIAKNEVVPLERDSGTSEVSIDLIHPNPDQPRKRFSNTALEELSKSIREKGILQPLLLRKRPKGKFQIIAGERRFRAAQHAGLHQVPAIIREFSDDETLQIALIENIQRDDLTPIEEARAYSQLIERFGHTQEVLAKELGKSRSHIANTLRLMRLPAPAVKALEDGQITAGHARAILSSDEPVKLLKEILKNSLSVRQAEAQANSKIAKKSKAGTPKDADTRALERDLEQKLGVRVSIDHHSSGRGKVTLSYKSLEQLDEVCDLLASKPKT